VIAVLPWLAAGLIWFGVIPSMRAEQEDRLAQQARVRRDRLKSERVAKDALALRARVGTALGSACRASTDPAALRQRTVAATSGLVLSPVTLAVTGGPDAGAQVDAGGSRSSVLELVRRLGDPGRGSFLRQVNLREKDARWSVSATTGVFQSFPGGIVAVRPNCPELQDPGLGEAATPAPSAGRPGTVPAPRAPAAEKPLDSGGAPAVDPTPAPPFTLVAFLMSEGKSRVSIRAGDQVRVVAVGDQIDGWRCIAIDRDVGVVLTSAAGGRLVLKARP
jgi:hypothetical protein